MYEMVEKRKSALIDSLQNNSGNTARSKQERERLTIQRKIDYGDAITNSKSEMKIPVGWSLYHATHIEHIPKIHDKIDVTKSLSTQLGKGFYTSWFDSDLSDYGAYVIRFHVNRVMEGQHVYSHKIREANQQEIQLSQEEVLDNDRIKAVKGDWDKSNDFLYTPKLNEKIDGQNVPHQVKVNAKGVDALNIISVIETDKKIETPIEDFIKRIPKSEDLSKQRLNFLFSIENLPKLRKLE